MASFNPQCITYSQMNLIFNARVYYRRLTTWTRAYINSIYYGIGTAEDMFARLYTETLDIGNMLQIIFGRVYSEQYSNMVSQFAIALRNLLTAQLEGNTEAVNQNIDRLFNNVAERAVFLESINPYWSAEEYRNMFNAYVQYTLEIANTLAAGDYSRYTELYDLINAHTNRMGDVFAKGIYDYITSGGYPLNAATAENIPCITYEQMNDIYKIRMIWFELVIWVRTYMLSRFTGTGDPEVILARLKQAPVEYIETVTKYFENVNAEEYLQLFINYIDLIDAFITAMLENNTEELNQITRSLYQNADERANFVASFNPYWTPEEWRSRLLDNLITTIEEATTFLAGDYARNINIFTRLLDQAENTGILLTQGIFNYIINYLNPNPAD